MGPRLCLWSRSKILVRTSNVRSVLRLLCSAQTVGLVSHEPAEKSLMKSKYVQARNATTTKGTSKAPICALSCVPCKLHIYIYSTPNTTDVTFQKAVEAAAMSRYPSPL